MLALSDYQVAVLAAGMMCSASVYRDFDSALRQVLQAMKNQPERT